MKAPALPDPCDAEEITPDVVAGYLASGAELAPVVIDCREADELAICRIEGSRWIPLGEFPVSLESLREHEEHGVIILCHHGMRSLRAARFLRQNGIQRAFSMTGGIDAWSRLIDSEVPRY